MRTKLIITAVLIMLLTCGCIPASQQEVQTLTGNVTQLLAGVDALQDTTKQLAADGIVNKEKVDKINAEIDKVQAHTAIIAKEVETADDPVEAIEKGWNASEPFNPYYGYGAAIIALLKLFQTTKQKNETENKYSAAKIGIDKFRNENPDKAVELYNDVGEARRAKKIA